MREPPTKSYIDAKDAPDISRRCVNSSCLYHNSGDHWHKGGLIYDPAVFIVDVTQTVPTLETYEV